MSAPKDTDLGLGTFHRDTIKNGQPPPSPSPDRPWVALWRRFIEARTT